MVQSQAVLGHTTLEPCNLAAKKIILASQVLLFGGVSTAGACYVLSVKPSNYCISTVNLDALPDFTYFLL